MERLSYNEALAILRREGFGDDAHGLLLDLRGYYDNEFSAEELHELLGKLQQLGSVTKKQPHRPKGTSFAAADAPLVAEMHSLIERGDVASPTEAANKVISRARGSNSTDESKVRRLVKRYKEEHGE